MHTCAYTEPVREYRVGPAQGGDESAQAWYRFADAATVLHDEHALTVRDDHAGEERFVSLGMDALGRLLVVVFTWRGDAARLISARKATRRERAEYEAGS